MKLKSAIKTPLFEADLPNRSAVAYILAQQPSHRRPLQPTTRLST